MFRLLLIFTFLYLPIAIAQQPISSDLTSAEFIDYTRVISEIPRTSLLSLEKSFSRESIPSWIEIIGSTAILYHNDEVILHDIQQSGREWGIGNEDRTKAVLSAGDIDILRLPSDTGSVLYFLGDGWLHGGIAAGFLYNGFSAHHSRAFNTGLQLTHGMIVSTLFNQFLKRSFGRESPYVKTEKLGRWSPYPSIPEYQSHTSRYDAMPSGHVMTTTLVFTIINENYPEYSHLIVPIGVTWTSLLAWQMVNNGVHWASDYPLGIAMGFVIGKEATRLGKQKQKQDLKQSNWMIMPNSNQNGDGLTFLYTY